MARLISQLDAATTPLAGTEVAWIEQGGVPKKVAVSEFGGGSGTIGGSIADNQVAIGNGTNAIDGSSALTFEGSLLTHSSAATRYRMIDTAAAVDNGIWELRNDNENFYIRMLNDAQDTETQAITMTRTGMTLDQIQLKAPTLVSGSVTATAFAGGNLASDVQVYVTGTEAAGNYRMVFSSASGASGNSQLFRDSGSDFFYDPSTNVLSIPIVSAGTRVNTLEVRAGTSAQLVLNAGESSSVATGQTAENVYINAEAGLIINSSPDNWAGGWGVRNIATINDANGDSVFNGDITLNTGNFYQDSTGSIQNNFDVGVSGNSVDQLFRVAGTLTALVRWTSNTNVMSWQDRSPSTVEVMNLDFDTGDLTLQTGALRHGTSYLDVQRTSAGAGGIRVLNSADQIQGYLYTDGSATFGLLHSGGGWAVQIAAASNTVTFPGTINVNGNITGDAATNVTGMAEISGTYLGVENTTGSNGYGLSLYAGATAGRPTYGMMFQQQATFGGYGQYLTADWATYFTMSNTAGRGWIWSTTSGTNIAGLDTVGNFQIDGHFKQTNKAIIQEANSQGGFIPGSPGGGQLKSSGNATVTGAIEINLPTATYASDDMINFWVDIYDYATGEMISVYIGGYVYQTVGLNEWVNCSAIILTDRGAEKDFSIRFGTDGTRHIVWIGEITDTWSHPQITVRDFSAGYTSDIDDWADGWSLAFEATAFSTVDETITSSYPTAGRVYTSTGNIIANTGTYAGVNTTTLRSGYAGYAILDGDLTMMSNGTTRGFYDDDNNEWFMQFAANGGVSLYNNGTVSLQTRAITESDFGTGARVLDGTGNWRPVGFNTMPVYEIDADDSFDLAHNGYIWHRDAGTAVNFTAPNDTTIPVGATYVVFNEGTDSIEITQGASTTLRWLQPGQAPATGNITVEQGGIVTVFKYSDAEWWCWGAKGAVGGIENVVEDTTPQLGGDLDLNGNDILSSTGTGKMTSTTTAGSMRITEDTGATWGDLGPRNTSYFHMETNASSGFYMYDTLTQPDNVRHRFGTGNDAQMYFNATDFYIDLLDGVDLRIRGATSGTTELLVVREDYITTAGRTSSVQIRDHGNVQRDAGFNDLRLVANNPASVAVAEEHMGGVIYADDNTTFTVTLPSSTASFPIGGVITIINANTSGNISIVDQGLYTCFYLDGSTRTDIVGTATLGPGGVATIWRQTTGGTSAERTFLMWGSGITA